MENKLKILGIVAGLVGVLFLGLVVSWHVTDDTEENLAKCMNESDVCEKDLCIMWLVNPPRGNIHHIIWFFMPKKEISICDKTSSVFRRNECIGFVAIWQRDVSLCERMLPVPENDTCFKLPIEKNTTQCKPKREVCWKDKCIGTSAKIGVPPPRMENKDDCIMLVAKAKRDASLCDKISNNSWKNDCIMLVAGAKGEVSICDKILPLPIRDNCVSWVAVKKEDISICDKTSNESARDNCISDIAMDMGDISICDKTSSISSKDGCITFVAITKYWDYESFICNKTSNMSIRDDCITLVAIGAHGVSFCNETSTAVARDECIASFAEARCDVSFCKEISNAEIKQECTKRTS